MRFIGLTGSIGMGKSTTAAMFLALGVPVHDSDDAVHRLYRGSAVASVGAVFPEALENGQINRRRLGASVLGQPERLRALELIIHPLVRADRDHFVAESRQRGAALVVFDVPLLFETSGERDVDVVVVVSANEFVQRERVLARPGMTPAQLQAILARQLPDVEKRRRAHYVIDTGHDFACAKNQVAALVRALA